MNLYIVLHFIPIDNCVEEINTYTFRSETKLNINVTPQSVKEKIAIELEIPFDKHKHRMDIYYAEDNPKTIKFY